MAAGGRSAPGPGGTRGRRRRRGGPRWSKSARRPPPPPPGAGTAPVSSSSAGVPAPLPPGAEVEVRVDDDGFHGSWFEATVVDFAPARGPRTPARYTVTYAHLLDDDGGGVLAEPFAVTHVRPRPPPPSDSSPPRFRPHDIVEAFHNDGWWSGVVVSAPDSPPDPGATVVTVAFPITREVIRFPPRLVRPRRDYVDGGWAPSRAAMVVRPKRAIKVYRVGDKVEVGRDRDVYGYSWFPATVARVVDDLSYVVEYFDLEEEGDAGSGKATEYLHWRFIRPAVEHMPRESEFRLGPGAAVEAYCDGAWSPGVVRRLVGDGEWEVSIVGKKAELLVTKVVELLKPQYKWNGKQWKIVTAKRRGNLRRRSMPGQNPSSPVEVISSADEYSHGPESSVTKKSRKKLQQLDAIVTEVSQMDTPLSALCKSPESNHSDSQVSEKNSLQPPSHGIVSSAPMNGLLCASSGRSTPQNESIANSTGETVDNQETLSEMMDSDGPLNTHAYGASAGDAHDMLSIAELRKKMVSAKTRKKVLSVKALEVKKGISKSKGGNTHPIQELHGKNDASDNIQLNGTINFSKKDIVCALSAFGEGQTTKTPDREVPRRTNRGSSTKVLAYKKLAKRNVPRELCSPHSSLDVTSTVQQRGRKKVAGPMEESLLAEELDKTLEDSWNIADLTEQDLLPMVPPGFESMYDENGAHIHGCLSEEEPNAMISEANINADVCTDHAATQVAKSNYPMKEAILSVDNQAQEGSRKVDERPILQCRQNAYSTQCPMDNASLRSCSASGISMPSPLPVSQVSGDVLFVKGSSMWALIEAMDVFKEVPQRPHFLSLRQLSPTLREGAALGLMVSFAELVKNTREASIDHSMEWFEDKMNTLCHLEANGFNVQFLQSTLTKLVHIKSDGTSYLGQIDKLKAQIVGKTASSSRMDAVLGEKDRGIAELEQKLGRLRQESQRIAQDKEHEEAELFRLQAARSRFEEAYGDTKRQFHNVLAELHRKGLT